MMNFLPLFQWGLVSAALTSSLVCHAWTVADVERLPHAAMGTNAGLNWGYTLNVVNAPYEVHLSVTRLWAVTLYRAEGRNGGYRATYELNNGDFQRLYIRTETRPKDCLQPAAGSLLAAVQLHLDAIRAESQDMASWTSGTPSMRTSAVITIDICGVGMPAITLGATAAPPSPGTTCSIIAPAAVSFLPGGAATRTVDLLTNCVGSGSADIRIKALGPTSVSPAPGVTIWSRPPTGSVTVGAGKSTTFHVDVGVDITSGEPGDHRASFVYGIEYL